MSKHLTVLLGAGFSANAGMPTAGHISEKFNRDLREKLLAFSSGEWAWTDDKSGTALNNGRLNFDYLAYSYVFNELVKSYVANRGSFIYYEDFYQFIIDSYENTEKVESIFENPKSELLEDHPRLSENVYSKNYLYAFEKKQFFKINEIINYLIGDILRIIPQPDDELAKIYQNFISYLKGFEEVDIFTLNHDLLLERLLQINKIEFSKGFNLEFSPVQHEGNPVPFFNNEFNKSIRIHKLHGSLDFFEFAHFKRDGMIWSPTGESDYFMTTNYYIKHKSVMINPQTKEIIQDYNFDVVPKFITGTNKTQTIKNDKMFSSLFSNLDKV